MKERVFFTCRDPSVLSCGYHAEEKVNVAEEGGVKELGRTMSMQSPSQIIIYQILMISHIEPEKWTK